MITCMTRIKGKGKMERVCKLHPATAIAMPTLSSGVIVIAF